MEKQSAGAKQRSYMEEHKREAAELVHSTGRTATALAAEIGVHPTLLCRWVKTVCGWQGGGGIFAVRPDEIPLHRGSPRHLARAGDV